MKVYDETFCDFVKIKKKKKMIVRWIYIYIYEYRRLTEIHGSRSKSIEKRGVTNAPLRIGCSNLAEENETVYAT